MQKAPHLIAKDKWNVASQGQLNLGLNSPSVWIKFSIKNNFDVKQQFFLFNNFVHLETLTLYRANQQSTDGVGEPVLCLH